MGKNENSGFFRNYQVTACSDLKIGRFRQLIESIKVCEY